MSGVKGHGNPNGRPKHGHSPGSGWSETYASWVNMHSRCRYSTQKGFRYCGAKGIQVCERWQTFEHFLADMGPRPSRAHSLDRIRRDEHYGPGNCRWATRREQDRNKQQTVLVTIGNRTMCATDWALENGLRPSTVLARIYKLGWDPVLAVSTPATHRRRLYLHGERIA